MHPHIPEERRAYVARHLVLYGRSADNAMGRKHVHTGREGACEPALEILIRCRSVIPQRYTTCTRGSLVSSLNVARYQAISPLEHASSVVTAAQILGSPTKREETR